MTREEALLLQAARAIDAQRLAAEKRDSGALAYVADDPDCPDVLRLAALMEELGEVARAIHDDERESLPEELAQLAGIALAWMIVLSSELVGASKPRGAGRPRKSTLGPPPVKPCAICLTPMKLVGKHYECPKHGRPQA